MTRATLLSFAQKAMLARFALALVVMWMLTSPAPTQSGWVRLSPPGATPPPRSGHAMAYDSLRHRLVLFGGEDYNHRDRKSVV